MRQYVDMHIHTTFSDGTKTVTELLSIIRGKNISAFAVTDHDNLNGYRAMKDLLQVDDPELIPGIELSTTYNDKDLHILAYYFDDTDIELNKAIYGFQSNRNQRGMKMVEKLNELNVDISFDDVLKQTDDAPVGRPHVARALFETGMTSSYEEGFTKYIRDNGPAFVPKENFTPKQAFDLVHNAGGLVFLAHPAIGNKDEHLELLCGYGLDGIEVYHPNHKMSDIDRFKHLAKRHRLLICGGSDYHGMDDKYGKVGSQKVPYKYFEQIKERVS